MTATAAEADVFRARYEALAQDPSAPGWLGALVLVQVVSSG